ncbi:hypothetical protein CL633_01205 [bacterium]|nr:hypothetical protein [bacterium]|tara:strand:+ start:517 stop:780 length:264 start_codon:yes stop_codon:yes gene_type:complete
MNLEYINKKIILILNNFLVKIIKGSKSFWLIFLIFLIGFIILIWIYIFQPIWYPKIQNEKTYTLEIDEKLFNNTKEILEQRTSPVLD